jgi:hypothetical protein
MDLVVVWDYHGDGKLVGVFKEGDHHLNRLREDIIKKGEQGYIQFIVTKINHQIGNI